MDYMSIITYIPRDGTRISRDELARQSGRSDRLCRRAIERARDNGVPVISSSRRGGYHIAATEAEIRGLLAEMWSRIRSMLRQYWTLKKRLKIDGQMTLYEMEELFKVKAEVEEDE